MTANPPNTESNPLHGENESAEETLRLDPDALEPMQLRLLNRSINVRSALRVGMPDEIAFRCDAM